MESLATTKLSSKGQVVIPEEIRLRLGLKEGTQFVVVGDRDVVILNSGHRGAGGDLRDLGRAAQPAAGAGISNRH